MLMRNAMMEKTNIFNNDQEAICAYTCKQAEEDGVLMFIAKEIPVSPVNYASLKLLRKGYLKPDGSYAQGGVLELVLNCMKLTALKMADTYSGMIQLPNGRIQEVILCRNDTGKHTVMLPEEY